MLKPLRAAKFIAITLLMSAAALGQQITVYSSGSVAIGTSRQLTAYVPLAITTVNWSVNGVIGGNSTYGTVSTNGLYQAPAVVAVPNAVAEQATITADRSQYRTVTITGTQRPVLLSSASH